MPYLTTTKELPFAPQSDTSHAGARAARVSAESRKAVMAEHYRRHAFTGLADFEMERLTGFKINIICGRRSDLKCVVVGEITGPCGVPVKTWALPPESKS